MANNKNNNVRIRPYVEADIPKLYECVINSQAEFRKYLPWANTDYQLDHSKSWVNWAHYNWMSQRQYDFVIEDTNTEEFLGGVGLLEVDFNNKHAQLGYWLGTPFTGKGLARQAAQLAVEFARNELKLGKLIIRVAEDNIASSLIAEKLGAQFIGKEDHQEFHNDHWQDTKVYELLLI